MSRGFDQQWRDKGNNEKDDYELAELFRRSSDAFDKVIADGTTNTLDLPSTYPFSPERYRYNINGTRYRDITANTQITRNEGHFIINPNQNDDIKFFSAERPRYVVGNDSEASASTKFNTQLEAGDTFRIGINDFQTLENGAFIELNGGAADQLVILKEGTPIKTKEITLPDDFDITQPARWAIRFNWYGVGRYEFTLDYGNDQRKEGSKQKQVLLGELIVETDYSTSDPVGHIFTEISTSNTGKEVEVGSFGYTIYGDVTETTRIKTSRLTGLSYGGSGDYEPVAAIRTDADYGNIFTDIAGIEIFPDTTEGELLALAVDPANTDATGFARPLQQSSANSIIEETTNVTTFPGTAANPSGRQVGFSTSDVTGQGRTSSRINSTQKDKRPIHEDDEVIVFYKADSASSDTINILYKTEQYW